MTVLVDIIPKYHKWTVALPIFYIFGISSLIVSLFIPFVNFLNALGKVKVTFSFMFLFTCIIWILTIVLTAMFGTYGFPIAHIVVSASYCFVLIKAKKYLKFDFLGSTASFLGATAIMGMVLALLIYFFKSPTYLFVALLIIAGASTYYLSLRFLFRTDLIKIVLSFLAMRKQT
jgi:O-antigen/teichoic acid export membrane protein